ncbi:MAG: potassium-transporting ATPase subunit C [Alphaproteobacteria bacterium]
MFIASARLVVATMLICVAGYASVILGIAQLFPDTAAGSLIRTADGRIVGSRLVGQNFTEPRYFWPRPSAAGKTGYDATAAAGSNKSPTSADLTARGRELVARYEATPERPLPADLAAASGGGLDPHITAPAALYQARRVADARGLPVGEVERLVDQHAFSPGGIVTPERIVSVLELNLALDRRGR